MTLELQALFPDSVATHWSADPAACAELTTEEIPGTTRFAPARLREFQRGRHCARQALGRLGVPACGIPIGTSREPCWPDGIVGSISHTAAVAAAAVAHATAYRSLGLDLEEDGPLDAGLVGRICRAEEEAWLGDLGIDPLVAARLVFSAKEAAYKALWPLTHQFLDFHELAIEPEPASGSFRVVPHTARCPASLAADLVGRYVIAGGLIAVGAAVAPRASSG